MTQYYFHDGQQEQGPYDIEQLKSQTLKKDTPIWYEGLESWTTFGEVEELKQLFAIKPTPPPLVKAVPEIKATPPKIEQPSITAPSYEAAFPTKKKSLMVPLIVGGSLVVIGLISWLVYQNSEHTATIDNLQEKVTTQDNAIQTQQTQDAEKEAERQRINIANTEKNKKYRNNWSDYISATSNRYSYREIGGIFGLEVVITNNTEYMLDEVEVQVGYIKDNSDYFKSETVRVYNIPANSSKSQAAPDSERGKSVDMTINGITSKKMHFCYSPGNWANNSEDPYFCK